MVLFIILDAAGGSIKCKFKCTIGTSQPGCVTVSPVWVYINLGVGVRVYVDGVPFMYGGMFFFSGCGCTRPCKYAGVKVRGRAWRCRGP